MRAERELATDTLAKCIPYRRDRLQSRLLVVVMVPVLLGIGWGAISYARTAAHSGSPYLLEAAGASLLFALLAWRVRAATAGAAACGGLICFDLTVATGSPDGGSIFHSGLTPLLLLFVLTHAATRFRRERKPASDAVEEKHGRNAAQVIANLGMAAVSGSLLCWVLRHSPMRPIGPHVVATLQAPMLAALAEAAADTVSSEIGRAVGGPPFLLTTLRRVTPGVDGAVSLVGTLAGVAAAGAIALTGLPALSMNRADVLHVLIAATAGLFFDSLLGATLERRGWIGNDLVNFASTCFAAGLCWILVPVVAA